jgi:tRNA threonylcarbamoyladenosine biosynthesis protein TsaB
MILVIDTATRRPVVALAADDGTLLAQRTWESRHRHGEELLARLDEALAEAGAARQDIAGVVVGAGPGSFTGLRIGLSAARGIALARAIPAVGIPSLLAISLSAPAGHPVAVLLDARRGEAYVQSFAAPGRPLTPAQLLPMAAAQAAVPVGATVLQSPFVDIALLVAYGATADAAAHPPEPDYVRDADAKPQSAARIARITP